ncbi:MAG TPA: hypothetical protein VGO58_07615 [Chitinophagaceae bacterium]|nr:hypothetical protein [Chitinophagaceae bacterium]
MQKFVLITITLLVVVSSFTILKKKKPKLPAEFVYIPSGSFSIEEDYNGGRVVTVMGFYISKYEISNKQYRDQKRYIPMLPLLSGSDR